MKGAIITLLSFIVGVILARTGYVSTFFVENDLSTYALYVLMTLVGISLGMDKSSLDIIKKMNFGHFLVPVSIAIGSIIGAGLCYMFVSGSFVEGMAVGAGFGYYSLSSVIISSTYNNTLGAIALLSNIMRELFTLVATPLLVKYFGNLSPIASAGATSMDTALPVISKYSGKDYAIIALFSGIVLTILVPILIPMILQLTKL